MVRRYEEPIEVRTPSGPAAVEGPDAFVWRGRFYQVREVIDHWQERRAWWREALDPAPSVVSSSGAPSSQRPVSGTAASEALSSTERQVWRVAASPGRLSGTGVYDLGADGDPARWLLLRTQD